MCTRQKLVLTACRLHLRLRSGFNPDEPPSAYAFGSYHVKTSRTALHIGFFLMCLRFQIAAVHSAGSDCGTVLVLIAGSFALSAWNPWAALFAFTLVVPLLNGLSRTDLLNCVFPSSLVFSALWTGVMAKYLLRRSVEQYSASTSSTMYRPSFLIEEMNNNRSGDESKPPRTPAAIIPGQLPFSSHFLSYVIDILIAAILLSFAWQLWNHRGSAELWTVFLNRAVLGYGDPWYFLTSAFLWLQGLFFFRMLIKGTEERFWISRSKYQGAEQHRGPFRRGSEGLEKWCQKYGTVEAWIKPSVIVFEISIATFFLIQRTYDVPVGYDTGLDCSPYEDIHSFGSIAVALFIYSVVTWRKKTWIWTVLQWVEAVGLLALVVVSWSRATWLAGAVFLLLVAWLRLPKKWVAMFVGIGAIAVIVLNVHANQESWNQNFYLHRLITLVRLEKPSSKAPDRLNLYHKAIGMIRERPFIGHGTGSFYLTSVRFARTGDPLADRPDFAHNVFLQIAAEEGVPVATLFAGLVAWTLLCGFRTWIRQRAAGPQCSADALPILGVTLAFGAYLQTQMTANSLNVYISNQFFFWFLMAAILAIGMHEHDRKIKALTGPK